MPSNPQSLAEFNRGNENTVADCHRLMAGPNQPLGSWLNGLAKRANATAGSTAAAATVTLGGVFHAGDAVALTLGNPGLPYFNYANNGGKYTLSYTSQAGDATLTGVAASIVAAINADPVLNQAVLASNAAGVITLTAKVKGTGFNATTLSTAVTGVGATTTSTAQAATFGAATAGAGSDDVVLFV
jgi:phage tail sheath gpL-like